MDKDEYAVLKSTDKNEILDALYEALQFQMSSPPQGNMPEVYSPKWTYAMCELLIAHAKEVFNA